MALTFEAGNWQVHWDAFEKQLLQAVGLKFPYANRNSIQEWLKKEPIPSAVLLLFALSQQNGKYLLFTRRTETVKTHKGQMAFPGGRCEPSDLVSGSASPLATALRETQEEVGVPMDLVRVIGALPALVTPSGFLIHPWVGLLSMSLEEVTLRTSPDEVAETLWISLDHLLLPDTFGTFGIWGATEAMAKNILDRWITFR